jgi:hypothetical protein
MAAGPCDVLSLHLEALHLDFDPLTNEAFTN